MAHQPAFWGAAALITEIAARDRLQPSLLDRLTDDEPGQLKESADKRVLSLTQLKASVLRKMRGSKVAMAWWIRLSRALISMLEALCPARAGRP